MVNSGLDVLLKEHLGRLNNRRIGLVTNPTGVTSSLKPNIDALRDAGVNLVALFSPEHGLLGAVADGVQVASGQDEHTGLPVHSLYGATRKPNAEMLNGIDVLLFDLQDVGVRFYTYTATLGLCLEACAEIKIPLIVLDRPNPINGNWIEGPIIAKEQQSFVGHGPLPIRFGMTMGELAQFYNSELNTCAELQIISMQGWERRMWFDETELPWVLSSPNMPHLSTAIVYPGMCLFEGTNLSVGRGTALPFETFGAPWIDSYALADAFNALGIDGAHFRPMAFTPTADKFADTLCYGVQIHVTDRNALRPVTMALYLLRTLRAMYPTPFEWIPASFNLLMGDASVMEKIDRGEAVSAIVQSWQSELDSFLRVRSNYLMYR
ncbi:MAG: DUF1343 domain-containing protein [Chloroflexi bacterium]|nr:DUF1343 domain-containing protein [Chloroflexota bacterium]